MLPHIVGVQKVVCTCGGTMKRTGGVFSFTHHSSTYYCAKCHKAVTVTDLPEEAVNEIYNSMVKVN